MEEQIEKQEEQKVQVLEKKEYVLNKSQQNSKLTSIFISVAREVIDDDITVLALTDKDLIFEINNKLKEKGFEDSIISFETWYNWKANERNTSLPEFTELKNLIYSKLNFFKKDLLKKIYNFNNSEDKTFSNYLTIIERKFKEWNLKQISENTNINMNFDLNSMLEQLKQAKK